MVVIRDFDILPTELWVPVRALSSSLLYIDQIGYEDGIVTILGKRGRCKGISSDDILPKCYCEITYFPEKGLVDEYCFLNPEYTRDHDKGSDMKSYLTFRIYDLLNRPKKEERKRLANAQLDYSKALHLLIQENTEKRQ